MNSLEKFILKHRVFCRFCPNLATRVIEIKFKRECVCDAHYAAYHPIQTGLERRFRMEAK